jgi:pimeloyl-ACP methyl ester carboxylesterase
MTPAEELEHLALVASISGIDAEIVLPQRRHVVVHGLRLHYLDWGGKGELPTVVFLHGAALSAHTWDVVCLALRQHGYHCLALDQRGHGDSEWPPHADYSLDAHLRDIEGFVEHLGLDQFVLVGHSMGGFNGFSYAEVHSNRLAAFAIVDAGPGIRTGGAKRIKEFVTQTVELDSLEDALQQALAFNPRRDPRLLRYSLRHNFRQLPSGKWARKHDLRFWSQINGSERASGYHEHFQNAGRIVCPTLVVRGALSDVLAHEDAERFAHTFPNARYVQIEGAGHTVQGDNPKALANALLEFLRETGVG